MITTLDSKELEMKKITQLTLFNTVEKDAHIDYDNVLKETKIQFNKAKLQVFQSWCDLEKATEAYYADEDIEQNYIKAKKDLDMWKKYLIESECIDDYLVAFMRAEETFIKAEEAYDADENIEHNYTKADEEYKFYKDNFADVIKKNKLKIHEAKCNLTKCKKKIH